MKPGRKKAQQKDNRTVTQPIGDNNWRQHAACLGIGGDVFYPGEPDEQLAGTDATPEAMEQAKEICQTCMVRFDCLQTALDTGERHGIWGGLTWPERQRLLHEQGLPTPPPPPPPWIHGTTAGYARHKRHKQPPCPACQQAEMLSRQQLRNRKKGTSQ